MAVSAVLFDLDGTLWDRDAAFRELTLAQHRAIPELAQIDPEQYVSRVIALDNHGITNRRSLYEQVVVACDLAPELAATLFHHFTTTYNVFYEPFPDAITTIQWLRAQRIKTGIITNGQTVNQQQKIDAMGLVPLMDVILISEREGVRKPDPAIFQRALLRLDVGAEAAWFIGDHPDADVGGAREAGMTAVWMKSWGDAPDATYTITTLDQLIPLVTAPPHPRSRRSEPARLVEGVKDRQVIDMHPLRTSC